MSIESEIEQIKNDRGLEIEYDQKIGDNQCVVIKNYPLPKNIWNKQSSDLLIFVLPLYPNSKLDMFWTDSDLVYSDNTIPQSAESVENYLGRNWRRFSRHITVWNPARDNLINYLVNIDHWLSNKSVI